jgi:hypothetical protein
MQLTNEIYPNKLFKFVNLRTPASYKKLEGGRNYFVSNEIEKLSAVQLAAIEQDEQLLQTTLKNLTNSYFNQEDVNNTLKNYYDTSAFAIKSESHFYEEQPTFATAIEWIEQVGIATNKEGWINMLNNTFGNSPINLASDTDFLANEQRLWDNLIFHFFANKGADIQLVPLIAKSLNISSIIKRIAENDQYLPNETKLIEAYNAQPLFQQEFTRIAGNQTNPDAAVNITPEPEDNTELLAGIARFTRLRYAKAELEAALEKKWIKLAHDAENQTIPVPDPEAEPQPGSTGESIFNLNTAEIEQLSQSTREIIDETGYETDGKVNAQQVIAYSERQAQSASTTDRPGATSNPFDIAIGNDKEGKMGDNQPNIYTVSETGTTLIGSNDICEGKKNLPKFDPCKHSDTTAKQFLPSNSYIQDVYVGDLIVTKQQLIKYALGEVAHIENAMLGEQRRREYRRLNRIEQKEETETKASNETERETQTTERFSMEKEIAKSMSQDFGISAGVNITAQLGPVKLQSNVDVNYSQSQQQSAREATSFSKEVTNRALEKIKTEVRTLKSVTIINETEDKTLHEYNNKVSEYAGTNSTPDHVNGVYRWVDKFYLNKLVNYGRRLFVEFMIPEPANFYLFRTIKKAKESQTGFAMPKHPKELILEYTAVNGQPKPKTIGIHSADDIDVYNYKFLAAYYGVEGVETYPETYKTIGTSLCPKFSADATDNDAEFIEKQSLIVPRGYVSISGKYSCEAQERCVLFVGNAHNYIPSLSTFPKMAVSSDLNNIGDYADGAIIPVAGKAISNITKKSATPVNITIICKVMPKHITEWKIKLHDKIMQAYNRKQQEFNEWLQQQKAMSDFDGQEIKGNNPEINRRIEKEELKKRCLEMFSGQRWETFDAATAAANNLSNYPEILFEESIKEGVVVKFFEKSFDWENITYEYFPYFYGNKERWCSITPLKDNDPVFENFLKAGFARVVVPVTPRYENILAQYMITAINMYGFPYHWFSLMGMSSNFIPGIEQVYFKNLFADLRAARELTEETGTVIGTYVEKVPTNLVYLASLDPEKGTPDLPDFTNDPQILPNITGEFGKSINETIDPSLLTTNIIN